LVVFSHASGPDDGLPNRSSIGSTSSTGASLVWPWMRR